MQEVERAAEEERVEKEWESFLKKDKAKKNIYNELETFVREKTKRREENIQ